MPLAETTPLFWTSRMGERAAAVLEEALGSNDPIIRLKAAAQIFDRGYGRPVQTADLTVRQERMVVEAPAVIEDADEWVERYAPKP
jgi:hypothetical protein